MSTRIPLQSKGKLVGREPLMSASLLPRPADDLFVLRGAVALWTALFQLKLHALREFFGNNASVRRPCRLLRFSQRASRSSACMPGVRNPRAHSLDLHVTKCKNVFAVMCSCINLQISSRGIGEYSRRTAASCCSHSARLHYICTDRALT